MVCQALGLIVALPISTMASKVTLDVKLPVSHKGKRKEEKVGDFNRAGLEVGMYTSAHIPLEITWSPLAIS